MISSGSASPPKSSVRPGPAQLTAPVWASRPRCKAVKSLWPTKRVPRAAALAIAFHGSAGRMRVRP